MLDSNVLELLASIGGVGAVFGVIMFWVVCRLFDTLEKDKKHNEERLTKIIDQDLSSRAANTTVLTELIIYLKARNGKPG